MIEFNDENLKVVSELIRKNLTPDLIAKKWRERNSRNPTFGHCHTAAGCLYKIFGSKAMHMHRGFDGQIYHWWVVDKNGNIIDLTSEQYTSIGKVPPYEQGEKSGMLGFGYKTRVLVLLDKVTSELNITK